MEISLLQMATETNAVPSPAPSFSNAATNISIPGRFPSNSFTPATAAAEIGRLNPDERDAYRADLLDYREKLGESLAERVPPWPQFKAIVEGLSSSLLLTQEASALSADVRDLALSANESTRPQTIIDALNETERIASNLRLLEQVNSISMQMRQLKEREARVPISEPFTSHGHSIATIFETSNAHLTRSSALDPRSIASLQPDYVGRAKEIADMRAAAFHKRLLPVEALNPIRKELDQRHKQMREELETLVLYGIYGVPECHQTGADFDTIEQSPQQKSSADLEEEVSLGKSFLPALPLFPGMESVTVAPNPAGFVELCLSMQEALPQIVLALDTLCGAGHACEIIEKITAREAQAVIEHAIQTEIQIAEAASTSQQSIGKEFSDKMGENHRSSFFRRESPGPTEKMCCATLNRICFHFTATLRRIVALANSLQRESVNLFSAIVSIREQMQHGLIFVLTTFLGTNPPNVGATMKPNSSAEMERLFSLLATPRSSTLSSDGPMRDFDPASMNPRYSTFSDMERRSSKTWDTTCIPELPESMDCSIFNLELMHVILKRFSREAERLLAPWHGFGKGKGLTSAALTNALDQFLHHMTETFVKALRRDLRLYVRSVLGKRAGSLLQPPPVKSRNSQNDHKPTIVIPPSPHVESLAHAIAVCLRIAISIPDIAQQIGSIISSEVLMALTERSKDALRLAKKWTDAGYLFQEGFQGQWNAGAHFQGNTCPAPGEGPPLRSLEAEFELTTPPSSGDLADVDPMVTSLATVVDALVTEGSQGPALLSQNEWRAVVRLIQGLNSITGEIQKWSMDSKLSQSGGLDTSVAGRWSVLQVSKNSCVYPLQQLRQRIRQGTTGTEFAMLSTVCAVLVPVEGGMAALEAQVVMPSVSCSAQKSCYDATGCQCVRCAKSRQPTYPRRAEWQGRLRTTGQALREMCRWRTMRMLYTTSHRHDSTSLMSMVTASHRATIA